jgi:hypothetical protein
MSNTVIDMTHRSAPEAGTLEELPEDCVAALAALRRSAIVGFSGIERREDLVHDKGFFLLENIVINLADGTRLEGVTYWENDQRVLFFDDLTDAAKLRCSVEIVKQLVAYLITEELPEG